MLPVKVGFVAVGRATFDLESANRYFAQSKEMLGKLVDTVVSSSSLLMSPEETSQYVSEMLQQDKPEVLVVQSTTFVDARFIQEIINLTDLPILLWGVREPRAGGGTRLSLNSMTGVNNLSNTLVMNKRKFGLLFGNPDEDGLISDMRVQLNALRVVASLKALKIGVLGKHPDGFFFSDANPDMLASIGPQLIELDLHESFRRAGEISETEVDETIAALDGRVKGLELIPQEGVRKFARFQTALLQDIKRQGISLVAVRCWPEFFNDFGAAACSTVSSFIDSGIMASCEADIHGAITMFIQHQLAESAPYLGDLVHIDESSDSGVFWHCGAGAFSLARSDTGAVAGLHPNRKVGFTMEFGLKAGHVSINRLGPNPQRPGSYRMLMLEGEALDEPQKFMGTSVEVGFHQPVVPLFKTLMKQGFEPHYSLVYANINKEMEAICEWLDIDKIVL
jgi:L-fucose isomerase-like protein